MLLLLFEIGKEHYVLDVNQVIEIVPLVNLKSIPAAPAYVAGLMNYRGQGTPVIDLNQLFESDGHEDLLSTRIIMVKYPVPGKGYKPLALIANNVTETVRTSLTKPPSSGILMHKSICENEMDMEAGEMIQWFDIKKIVPAETISPLLEDEA